MILTAGVVVVVVSTVDETAWLATRAIHITSVAFMMWFNMCWSSFSKARERKKKRFTARERKKKEKKNNGKMLWNRLEYSFYSYLFLSLHLTVELPFYHLALKGPNQERRHAVNYLS